MIFAGTTEGRQLSEKLAAEGIFCEVCVATEYGEQLISPGEYTIIKRGRLSLSAMQVLMETGRFAAVVDATHPYAAEVSKNIKESANRAKLPCLRLKRNTHPAENIGKETKKICYVDSHAACARRLERYPGNILLTTGSKELKWYTKRENLKERLFVRVLPGMESIALCKEEGIPGNQIIAMQGPFCTELNEALIRQYHISVLVTKESGNAGGFPEKIAAAAKTGIPVLIIGNPDKTEGDTMEEVRKKLHVLLGLPGVRMEIFLVGTGMGSTAGYTGEAKAAVKEADYLFGARRLLSAVPAEWNTKAVRTPYYRSEEILPILEEAEQKEAGGTAVILYSGDTGFYSGAAEMYESLLKAVNACRLHACIRICPGISSVSYLGARIGKSWQDAKLLSIHGRTANLTEAIRTNEKVFLLTSGLSDVKRLGAVCMEMGLYKAKITAGFALSSPEEKILHITPQECERLTEEGLYTCLIENPAAEKRILTPGISDKTFLRGQVPMTKEEVRALSLCKLALHKNAVFYDIGSGTGSVSIEAAKLSDSIEVYAVEKKEAALSLQESNRKKFGLQNITLLLGEAPGALIDLPVPTHAFIGGTGGKLKEILQTLYEKNNTMHVVISAITLETVAEATAALSFFPLQEEEILQVQVSRSKAVASYHMMQAENPIYIFSFRFHV